MRDMIEELIGYLGDYSSSSSLIKHDLSLLRRMLKKIGKSGDELSQRAEYVILCEVAFSIFKNTGGLPSSVIARMLLNEQNYWTRIISAGFVDIHN